MTKPFNINDLAYFAGLLDGEGTFSVVVRQRENRKKPWRCGMKRSGKGVQLMPIMCFNMKGENVVKWAKKMFGGVTHINRSSGTHGWKINKFQDLADLIPQLLPFLKVKQEQAQVVLDFVHHRFQQEEKHGRYHALYDQQCFDLAEYVRSLNGNNKPILGVV